MRNPSGGRRVHLLLLAVLAVGASLPRFGQRENEAAARSDSDYYLDMAAVYAGQKPGFDPAWSAPSYPSHHHYTRPLLPLLAGSIVRAAPAVGLRAAMSAVNLAAAWVLAAALYLVLIAAAPTLRLSWLPSALYLTGFPQVDWGYHLLTDTLGLATAFVAAGAAWALLRWQGSARPAAPALLAGLAGLFALTALAFFARETGWMVPAAVAVLLLRGGFPRGTRAFGVAVLLVAAAAAVPWLFWVKAAGLRTIAIPVALADWVEPGYVLDFVVKTGVAFHLAWVLAGIGARKGGLAAAPDLLVAWAVAALLYMGAGYAHNSLGGIGYPLRLSWSLFPLVYFLVAWGLERSLRPARVVGAAALLVAANAAIGVGGTLLDRGATGVTVPGLIRGEPRPPR